MQTQTYALPATDDVATLAAAYREVLVQEKSLKEHKDALAQSLKVAAEQARDAQGLDPATTRVLFEGGGIEVSVTPVESWRLDTTRLKAEHPETYVMYASRSVSTRLVVK